MTKSRLAEQITRRFFRGFLHAFTRGKWESAILMEELRRAKGGSLGIVSQSGKELLIDAQDHLIWCSAEDTNITPGLIKTGNWQRAEFDLAIKTLIEHGKWRGGQMLDIGANIGTQSIYGALRSDIAHVHALEPEPENFERLANNISLNRLGGKITAHAKAVTTSSGSVFLRLKPELQGMHSVVPDARADTIEVPAVSVNDFLAAEAIDPASVGLVWIDVEGHEIEVLRGASALSDHAIPFYF